MLDYNQLVYPFFSAMVKIMHIFQFYFSAKKELLNRTLHLISIEVKKLSSDWNVARPQSQILYQPPPVFWFTRETSFDEMELTD